MKKKVGIVGATGLVGTEMIKRLEERSLDVTVELFASKSSAGKKIPFKNTVLQVQELTESSLLHLDYLLFAAGGEVSKQYAPIAASKGIIVIDNSSEFRMDPNVPLVVPEINAHALKHHKGIIANPNCSTIQSVLALYPIVKKYGAKRIIYSTYQSVSGSGLDGLADLEATSKGDTPRFYPYKIANNLLPHIDVFLDNGYTKEETKMILETQKIFEKDICVTATAVRVPTQYAHAVSINLETEQAFALEEVLSLYQTAKIPGLVLQDDPNQNLYPMPLTAEGKDEVFVGRIRRDFSTENGLNLWCVSDNIRKGASTNAVQILEHLLGVNRCHSL